MVVNNYKNLEQTKETIENIEESTGHMTITIDYKESDLHEKVLKKKTQI